MEKTCSNENNLLTWFLSRVIKVWAHHIFSLKAPSLPDQCCFALISFIEALYQKKMETETETCLLPLSQAFIFCLKTCYWGHEWDEWWWKKNAVAHLPWANGPLGEWASSTVLLTYIQRIMAIRKIALHANLCRMGRPKSSCMLACNDITSYLTTFYTNIQNTN